MTQKRRLPDWLTVSIPAGVNAAKIERNLSQFSLNTVCHEARCPNMAECFGHGTLTFMILGKTCTRNCRYCNVNPGTPQPVDFNEPDKIAVAVSLLKLGHVVITSVTRDDLDDSGVSHFANAVKAVRAKTPVTKIELLVPDFKGDRSLIETAAKSAPDVMGHNIETVKRLFPSIRPLASYLRSLEVLSMFKQLSSTYGNFTVKSGLMIGLGETDEEIRKTLQDLHDAGVAAITIGQYLQPSKAHETVKKFYTPEEFVQWKAVATAIGFSHVESGPLVRSSYHAERINCR